ncbi:S8/S53 family peptidase [Chitinophaga sedimenti]|uniref:S8/S53 family peptidase n=1 Tax=Chitinophaga sedimenti TaxID=2033606 RepID=UPI0027E0817F|nr:S8/S53 family peptidase [Chitinophaga sedimenti]
MITICCGIKASTPNVDAVIQNIWHKHIFVAAAGNKASGVDSPANLKGMISVGAITLEGGDSGYKTGNYGIPSQHPKGKSLGEGITIMAPGAGIKAYWQNNVSQYFDGTSAATPFVAGVVALLLSDLKHRQISTSSLSLHSHIRQKLITTAFQTNASGDRKLWGNGILDARKFVID